ncbi:hypothetical protein B7P43_G04564 [Cryptotermes secundus]|uniref:MD-2-related lipid-recognition domain-containing protein n=1 Tax=Cryptotermes secundus TaxID=105785 RepID=A0A2J7QLM4_9NEOP|nr:hypothetical protein B7P43_G04564 [Cryptotermes secundus]
MRWYSFADVVSMSSFKALAPSAMWIDELHAHSVSRWRPCDELIIRPRSPTECVRSRKAEVNGEVHGGDKGPKPIEVRVKGCDELPCIIKRGENIVAEVDFVAEKSVESLNVKVKATVLGITVDYPLPQPDACKSLIDSACPLEAGDIATYTLDLPITPVIPTVPFSVDASLINGDSEEVVSCFGIDGEVVA